MSSLAERLAEAAKALCSVTETPELEAQFLLAHALKVSRVQLLTRLKESTEAPAFDGLLERRLAFEPLAYILGEWEFFSLSLWVEPPVLVPRPETEHLVEVVLEFVGDRPARILELGTGTGCVAAALACHAQGCSVVATDRSVQALQLARRNAARHNVADRIAFRCGDLFEALMPGDAPFDVICSNPPYVEEEVWEQLSPSIRLYEDPEALLAGKDGLDVVRRLVEESPQCLKPGGFLAFEIGLGQYEMVQRLLEKQGYSSVQYRRDLAGIPRIVGAIRP